MRRTRFQIATIAWLACGLVLSIVLRAEDPAAAVLRIQLRDQATVGGRIVTLGDVAEVRGGTAALRARAGGLDIIELAEGQESDAIPRQLVVARLLIGGVGRESFEVSGAETVRVQWRPEQTADERVLSAIRRGVEERLYVPQEEIVVELAQPLPAALVQMLNQSPDAKVESRFAATPTGGRTRVDVWVTSASGQTTVTPAAVDVRFRQLVPVVAESISPRRIITADAVTFTEREVSELQSVLQSEQVVGMAARRQLAPGEVIGPRDLTEPTAASEPVVIKARDLVRLTARKGNLVLTVPAAEALQAGRKGEFIRVRNPTSGRTILGRVTGPGEVEVPL